MKEEFMQRLQAVYAALGQIAVSGYDNQRNMIGCMDCLTEMAKMLGGVKFVPEDAEKETDNK